MLKSERIKRGRRMMNKVSILPTIIVVCVLIAITIIINSESLFEWFIPDNSVFITSDTRSISEPFIILDSNDSPHITWNEGGSPNIYYVRRDGKKLVTADEGKHVGKNGNVSRSSYRASESSMIALDSNDNPHIVWIEMSKVAYLKWSNENWITANGDNYKENPNSVYVSNNRAKQPVLVIDNENQPHISWIGYTADGSPSSKNGEIMYVSWDGSNWKTAGGEIFDSKKRNANISGNSGDSTNTQIILDSKNNPNIVWQDNTNSEYNSIHFIRWNNSNWETINGDVYSPETMNSNVSRSAYQTLDYSFDIDATDNPHITWVNQLDNEKYGKVRLVYTKWNGTSWVDINGSAYLPDKTDCSIGLNRFAHCQVNLVLDSKSFPHLVWESDPWRRANIYYAKWNGSNWVTVEGEEPDTENFDDGIDDADYHGYFSSFALDSNDNPHVIWCISQQIADDLNVYIGNIDRLVYARWNGKNWVCVDGSVHKKSN
jgi:hypothetical protein